MRKLVIGVLAGLLVLTSVPTAQAHHPRPTSPQFHDYYYVIKHWHPNNDTNPFTNITDVRFKFDTNRDIPWQFVAPVLRAIDELNSYGSATNVPWASHNLHIDGQGEVAISSPHTCATPGSANDRTIVIGYASISQPSTGFTAGDTWACFGSSGYFRNAYIRLHSGFNLSNWHWGTAKPGAGQIDVESLVLHELVHAIGFMGGPGLLGSPNPITGSTLPGAAHFQSFQGLPCPVLGFNGPNPFTSEGTIRSHGGTAWCQHDENTDPIVCNHEDLYIQLYQTMCYGPGNIASQTGIDAQYYMRTLGTHDKSAIRTSYDFLWSL
ncbi:MAG TPA: hypothetical protein VGB52_15010 [Actinomycetota bacterium]